MGKLLCQGKWFRIIQIDHLHNLNLPSEGQVSTTFRCAGLPCEAASAKLPSSFLQESAVLSRIQPWGSQSSPWLLTSSFYLFLCIHLGTIHLCSPIYSYKVERLKESKIEVEYGRISMSPYMSHDNATWIKDT